MIGAVAARRAPLTYHRGGSRATGAFTGSGILYRERQEVPAMFTAIDSVTNYASYTPGPALRTAFAAHSATARPEELLRAIESFQLNSRRVFAPR